MFYPRVILSATARSAQRPLMTRMVAPSLMTRMYASASHETVESRILDILKGFDKVNPENVKIFLKFFFQNFQRAQLTSCLFLGYSSIQLHQGSRLR